MENTNQLQEQDHDWCDDLVLLYCEKYDSLVTQATRIVKSRDIAEELVQDAFVTFHTKSCKPAAGRELAYLRSIALNSARSHLRRATCEDRHRSPDESAISVEDLCIRSTEAETVVAALRQLPEQQRRVMLLRYWGGLSEHEIADRLGISSGSVKTHASRARRQLQAYVSER